MTDNLTAELEQDPFLWLACLFPGTYNEPLAEHQVDFWRWVWSIRRGQSARPYVAAWPRGHSKSTNAETATVALGAMGARRYGIYVCRTTKQAELHLANIAGRLETPSVARWYPDLADRDLSKYGHSRGWNRQRLTTRAGFYVDALGLDSSFRGLKHEDQRPDWIIIDEVDEPFDSFGVSEKLEMLIRADLLPAGSRDAVVLAIQNVVTATGVFAKLTGVSEKPADWLADRIVSGPIPALLDPTFEQHEGRALVTSGTPTWTSFDLAQCQKEITLSGLDVFLRECQHDVTRIAGGMFDHLEFVRAVLDEAGRPRIIQSEADGQRQLGPPVELIHTVCWVDPAVTSKDDSDCHAIQVDGLGEDGKIYRLFSWEQRATPVAALCKALEVAERYHCTHVGIETIHGKDTWGANFREAQVATGIRKPMREQPTSMGHESKVQRASHMLAEYETGGMVHVEGTHLILEMALRRFPKVKPFDLVDAAGWAQNDLRKGGPMTVHAPSTRLPTRAY